MSWARDKSYFLCFINSDISVMVVATAIVMITMLGSYALPTSLLASSLVVSIRVDVLCRDAISGNGHFCGSTDGSHMNTMIMLPEGMYFLISGSRLMIVCCFVYNCIYIRTFATSYLLYTRSVYPYVYP